VHGHSQIEARAVLEILSAWHKRRRTPTPNHSRAVAVVPPVVTVVRQRVCSTAPVAEADYSLQKTNGAAGERYVGRGRRQGKGGRWGAVALRRR